MNIAAITLAAVLGLAASPAVAATDTLDELRQQFTVLYDSLKAQRGMSQSDRSMVDQLRQRAAEYNRAHRDDPAGLALELQLCEWLGDRDRINELYGQLTRLTKDIRYGTAWAGYFEKRGDRARVGEIYDQLAKLFPGEVEVQIGRARFLKGANQYGQALAILQNAALDPAVSPRAFLDMSECLFAEQRFDEAVAALEKIPLEVQKADPSLASEVEAALAQRRPYIELWAKEQEIRSAEAAAGDLPRVRITTARGPITLELFENQAPNTVANFVSLAESGFYDGTTFHRVIPNFMAQGGDPNTKAGATGAPGTGNPGYRIADEFGLDGARMHFTGSLSMAKETGPNTGGCQFFITDLPTPQLNGKHTVFGRVLEGQDVVWALEPGDLIESITVLSKRDHPYEPQKLPDPGAARVPADARGTILPPAARDTGTTAPPEH